MLECAVLKAWIGSRLNSVRPKWEIPDYPDMNKYFEVIVTEHRDTVFGMLYSLLRDREMAEDLTQDTFILLTQKIDEIDLNRPILPWLLTSARNLAANARRRRSLEHRIFLQGDAIEQFWERFGSVTLGVDLSERLEALRDCRENLSPQQRDTIALFYEEHLPCEQIAERQKTATAAIYNRLARGRKALHTCITRKLQRDA